MRGCILLLAYCWLPASTVSFVLPRHATLEVPCAAVRRLSVVRVPALGQSPVLHPANTGDWPSASMRALPVTRVSTCLGAQSVRHFPRPSCARVLRHSGPAVVSLRGEATQAEIPPRNVLKVKVSPVEGEEGVRDVYLVGTMHYNPVSLQRTRATVDALAERDALSAVVIESCATRYAKWKDAGTDTFQRKFLESEMQVASDRAKAAGVELILGDQPIEDLGARTKVLFQDTLRDIASPLDGGWSRCAEDVRNAATAAFPAAPPAASFTGLGLRDILDPALVAAAPVSLVRYPLAWLVRSPVSVLALSFGLVLLMSHGKLLTYTALPCPPPTHTHAHRCWRYPSAS